MDHPFMKSIYAQTFDREAYTQYLVGQYLIFHELERLASASATKEPFASIFDEDLHRSVALENDLLFWCGKDWRDRLATPSGEVLRYLDRLRMDSQDEWLLLCHHFLHYNAMLSGGQFLGDMVSSRAAKEHPGQAPGAGAAVYRFPQSILSTDDARVQRYLDAFDAINISAGTRDRMLSCMRDVYRLLLALFSEAYAIAPVEGIDYAQSKASEAGIPPPPLTPLKNTFTLQQLQNSKGILTSLLGRVYDCEVGKEFFGPGGPYEMFAGHDGTYNLAVMSLKKKTLNKFKYKLEDEDKETLADWIAYFDHKYGAPVGTLIGVKHPISLNDIPRAKKIPFSETNASSASSSVPPSKL
eukprot:CAMPEP_0169268128 /NCGR_PEP_ID=MMETSP1016-20121227/47598_1 /TAXON_ID=342587 /ORGANISM="Karlodinium micrum, Strain CCMP2283" /LENGTH=354 /DNA_ID=CAMNT_0009352745 /DNA_START=9 /DNA_END=1074 /DNA_ORIENTATION=-